ncbi:ankyrin repeat domain protein [Nitzschia inconspicua]|uniref:Ankyrin repeat domain protein n=1 Tax=Nitzschia inconspicua TaxID=303405 RepID=A0A9K3Q561_9STRA|nr:ankyrin repeat domain protein [Nitzschia inconspicua]
MTPTPTSTSTANKDAAALIRPTEAQLRYSQFHHKRRAQAVKQWILELYETPKEVTDDVTAESDDDNYNSSDTNTSALRKVRQKRRPPISAGRRALLKRSRRKYCQRRQAILKSGYRGFVIETDNAEGGEIADIKSGEQLLKLQSDDGAKTAATSSQDFQVEGVDAVDVLPELDDIFMTRPKRRRPRQLGIRTQQDNESYKRFQAACHAMMMNIKTSHVTTPKVATPTKRWKRSEQHIKAAEELQHPDYLDFKWGVRKRSKMDASSRTTGLLLSAYYHQNHQIMDRGASWMMHLPKHVQYNRDTPYYHNVADLPPGSTASGGTGSDFTSSTLAMRTPGPKKFNKLVAFVQQRLIEKEKAEAQSKAATKQDEGEAPKMRLRETHLVVEEEPEGRRTSRAKDIAESMEAKPMKDENNNRIRQIAKSLEGGNQTPTMKLKTGLEIGTGQKSLGSQQRRARYVPRMRLRDFAVTTTGDEMEDDDDDDIVDPGTDGTRRRLVHNFQTLQDGTGDVSQQAKSMSTPTMTLRESSTEMDDKKRRRSKTKELALAMEEEQRRSQSSGGKIKEMARSLEPDRTPKMKLRNSLADGYEEKKISEDSVAPTSKYAVQTLAKEFQSGAEMAIGLEGRASLAPSDSSARVRSQADTTDETNRQADASSEHRESDDFFAKLRKTKLTVNQTTDHGSPERGFAVPYPTHDVKTPSRNSDAASDVSRESNLSGLWNRGRNSISALTKSLNTIAENQADKLPPEIKERASSSISALTTSLNTIAETHADKLPPEIIERASNVSGRVSDFFSQLRNQGNGKKDRQAEEEQQQQEKRRNEVKQSPTVSGSSYAEERSSKPETPFAHTLLPSHSEDSHEALAAYRKKRETLSPDIDKTSEASSFHALPNEIREVVQKSKASPALISDAKHRFVTPTSTQSQATTTRSAHSELSNEKLLEVVKNATVLGHFDQDSVIDTDDVNSDVDGSRLDPQKLANLMMSPDVLQKRLKQAIRAVERRNWEQVLYFINANPWLAEMKELTTNQFLLHKLAFFGGGSSPAPIDLCEKLVEKFPSAVYKFDQDGNVPLHLAAAAGNLPMIEILGEKFESGASIRNEDGMLPLHFTIASLADFASNGCAREAEDTHSTTLMIVQTVLKLFPKAVAIADNMGNIPLHVAAECLDGTTGVDVVYLLIDEAERQLSDPFGARFRNKLKLEEVIQEDMSTISMSTDREAESSINDGELHCTMVLNNQGETPLLAAIRSRKGWEIIEALLSGPDGHRAALSQDADQNNALHLLVGEFQDATAAMSILKMVPEAATVRNGSGMLPIEMACMLMMPEEVILAIALVDLPFSIDDQNGINVHEGRGGSWYFLTCESDDHMIEIVQEIVSICSFQQLRELCFMIDTNSGNTVIERATPKCRAILSQALRFLGRFEFVGNGPILADPNTGFKAFDALDFGGDEIYEGKRVLLECYDSEEQFEQRVHTLLSVELDDEFVEKVDVYVEYLESPLGSKEEFAERRCVAIERPQLTLDKVVSGMQRNGGYQNDFEMKMKYCAKVCSVLRLIGKALRHLHESGIVHGNLRMETCGKFTDSWKLLERLDVHVAGESFDASQFRYTFPPESLQLSEQNGITYDSDSAPVSFVENLIALPSIDIWAFGQVCYEALMGRPLVEYDRTKRPSEDVAALLQIMEWDQSNMQSVFSDLLESGIEESGADMITSCLFPNPEDRPASMQEVLDHPFWMDMKKYRSKKVTRTQGSLESSFGEGQSTYEV